MTLEQFIQKNSKLPANEIVELFRKYNRSTFEEKEDDELKEFKKQFKVDDYYSFEFDNNVVLFHIGEIPSGLFNNDSIIGEMICNKFNNFEYIEYMEYYQFYFIDLKDFKINKIDKKMFNTKLNELNTLIQTIKTSIDKSEKIEFKKDDEFLSLFDFMCSNPTILGEDIKNAYYDYQKEYHNMLSLNRKSNIDLLNDGTILYSKKRNYLIKINSLDTIKTNVKYTFIYICDIQIYMGNHDNMLEEIINDYVILPNVDFDVLKSKYEGLKLI